MGFGVLGFHCWLQGLDIKACISQNRGTRTPPSGSHARTAGLQGILAYIERTDKKMGTTKSIGGHNIGIMENQLQVCRGILGMEACAR